MSLIRINNPFVYWLCAFANWHFTWHSSLWILIWWNFIQLATMHKYFLMHSTYVNNIRHFGYFVAVSTYSQLYYRFQRIWSECFRTMCFGKGKKMGVKSSDIYKWISISDKTPFELMIGFHSAQTIQYRYRFCCYAKINQRVNAHKYPCNSINTFLTFDFNRIEYALIRYKLC